MPKISKPLKDMRLEYKSLFESVARLRDKGEDITKEEAAQMQADSSAAKALRAEITQAEADAACEGLDEMEADVKAMFAPDRPQMGGDGASAGGGPGNRQVLRQEAFGRISLGESLVNSDAYKAFNPGVKGATFGLELPNLLSLYGHTKATFTTAGSTFTSYDRPPGMIMVEQQRLTVADLLGQGMTDANTIRYMREDTYTNAATTVAEEGQKPEASFDTSEADAPVRKIAVIGRVTNEFYDDFPGMRSYIDGRLRYMVGAREEAQILLGNGSSPNLTGILDAATPIQTQAQGTDTALVAIHKAITKVRAVGFFEPDAIVMHPTDYQIIRLDQDGNGQFYGGGPFTGQYGNGGYPQLIGPWGLRVVVTTAISAGTALVGAFKLGAMLFRRAGVQLSMTNSDGNDFTYNRIAIRAEERLALAIWRPKAFCSVTSLAAVA